MWCRWINVDFLFNFHFSLEHISIQVLTFRVTPEGLTDCHPVRLSRLVRVNVVLVGKPVNNSQSDLVNEVIKRFCLRCDVSLCPLR